MFWADKVKKQKPQLLINLLFLVSFVTHWKAGIKSHSRVWTSQRSQRYCDCVQWSWLGLKVAVRCSLCVIRQWITATKLHNIARVASSQDLVELRFRNSSRNCDVVVAGRQHRCSDPSLSYGSKTSWTESQRRVVDTLIDVNLVVWFQSESFSNLWPEQLPCNQKRLLQPLAISHRLQKATRFSKLHGVGVLLP